MQHPILDSRMEPRIGPLGRRGGRRPARGPEVLKTLQFPMFWRPAEQLCPLSEISDKVPTICHNVCFPLEISTLAAAICSRLQPQPHCARQTVQNHLTDHPTCFSPLLIAPAVAQGTHVGPGRIFCFGQCRTEGRGSPACALDAF